MTLSDSIAAAAFVVSLVALAITLLSGRRAELVITWEFSAERGTHYEHIAVENVGQTTAKDVEVRLLSEAGEDMTEIFFQPDQQPFKLSSLAPRHQVAARLLVRRTGQEDADLVTATWTDRRLGQQHLRTVIAPQPARYS